MQQDVFIGKKLGDFIVQERLSQGMRSTVYRAFQTTVNRDVALKLTRIDRRTGQDETFRKAFSDAAREIAALSHIHILPIYDYGVEDEVAYIAMRLTQGETLESLLERTPIPELGQTLNIITQVGRALSYAHRKGIIHHDLKPENVLLDDTHNAYLSDFGLNKLVLKEDMVSSRKGFQLRKLLYTSPEQIRGEPLTPRSDVFCLGLILYRMVVGRLPYDIDKKNIASIIHKHATESAPKPRTLNPDVPPVVEAVILKAMSIDPMERYADTDEMVETLNESVRGLFERVHIPDVPTDTVTMDDLPKDAQASGQNRLMLVSVGIVALSILVALIYVFANPSLPPMVILEGESAPAEEISPAQATVRIAGRRLQDDGFIAYIACNLQSEFHAARAREIKDMATAYNLPLEVYDSGGDPSLEIATVERARADGASALIHCVVGQSTIATTLADALANEIEVVVDTEALIDDLDGAVFIANNDYGLGFVSGATAGDYIQRELNGEANVLILDYPPETANHLRANGLEDGLLEVAPQATIVGRYTGADPTSAQETMGTLIGDEVEFDVILTVTDAGAYGVVRALEFGGFTPDEVAIYSIDAEQLAQSFIRDGNFMRASARPDRSAVSAAMMDAMVMLLGGGAVPERVIPPTGDLFMVEGTDG